MLQPLRSGRGWPSELIHHVWERAGGSKQEWEQLVREGFVEEVKTEKDLHFRITSVGRKVFEDQKKGHWI